MKLRYDPEAQPEREKLCGGLTTVSAMPEQLTVQTGGRKVV
jgi:hypothetical protein